MLGEPENQFSIQSNSTNHICSRTIRSTGLVLGALMFLMLEAGPLQAQTNEEPQIIFLHLKFKSGTISLVDSVTRPGVLKVQRDAPEADLHYELISATGQTLWQATSEDPSTQHLEYEEPPHSGVLKRRTIHLVEVEFTVRVPFMVSARRVDFFKLEPQPPGTPGVKSAARRNLGSIVLP
jgi:hypothetical protein